MKTAYVHLPGGGEPKKKEQDSTKAAKLVMSKLNGKRSSLFLFCYLFQKKVEWR